MSKDTWYKVEGTGARPPASVRSTTYTRVDGVLHWAAGSCMAILDGGEPIPIEHDEDDESVQYADMSKERLGEEIEIAVQGATIATTDLPADQIRKINELVVESLRRRGVL
ncbi:hypothetical protein [Streptomyces sp. WMMC897]|uniref:hypothetical protein n=1 Tax=Streptomyces sp. WMMC897 TaxID=3014782 RepID=UPI0022B70C9C|nr:hypothetical protein [Streptomyces sp. WMMC897]MCZ7413098.1 hypothetical protein [Streptomyces sp. WMMC897]MCZ7413160.1 hypothetical protein [Streptomyces sp. WMMC897]MCZ7415518.1 hypothetical protein [Streptomyces sp. WMMC897]